MRVLRQCVACSGFVNAIPVLDKPEPLSMRGFISYRQLSYGELKSSYFEHCPQKSSFVIMSDLDSDFSFGKPGSVRHKYHGPNDNHD